MILQQQTNSELPLILIHVNEDVDIRTHTKRAIVSKLINDKWIVRVTPWFDVDYPVGALKKATENLINNPYMWRDND